MFYLLLLLTVGFGSPDIDVVVAKHLTFENYYEESDKILSLTHVRDIKNNNEYNMCRLINAFQQNNHDVAEKHLKYLEDSFEPLPRRYEALIFIMREDIDRWKPEEL